MTKYVHQNVILFYEYQLNKKKKDFVFSNLLYTKKKYFRYNSDP